jgi:hypothetical protein
MPARTLFLARLIGLFLIAVGLSMLVQGHWMAETITALAHDQPLVYVLALITFACGLAIVLAHNRWSGGALPVVVTILGWIILIKGLVLLLLPPGAEVALFARLIYLYAAVDLAIGIYLAWAGFTTRRPMD